MALVSRTIPNCLLSVKGPNELPVLSMFRPCSHLNFATALYGVATRRCGKNGWALSAPLGVRCLTLSGPISFRIPSSTSGMMSKLATVSKSDRFTDGWHPGGYDRNGRTAFRATWPAGIPMPLGFPSGLSNDRMNGEVPAHGVGFPITTTIVKSTWTDYYALAPVADR
jgi:hypothetical protein